MVGKSSTSPGYGWVGKLVCGVCVIGVAVAAWLAFDREPPATPTAAPPTPEQKALGHVADAHRRAEGALGERVKSVQMAFQRARVGAPAFAEAAVSWRSKLALVRAKLGEKGEWGLCDPHSDFIREAFAKHVLKEDDLKSGIESAVKGLVSDLDGIENELLVQLRADLADSELGRNGKLPLLLGAEVFQAESIRLAVGVMQASEIDGGVEAGRQLGGLAAMDLATPVVTRILGVLAAEMGIEGSILGAGAASSVATFGIGIGVAVVADYGISWALKKAGYDPERDIAAKVCESLTWMEGLVIDGTAETGGLKKELGAIAAARAKVRDSVVRKVIDEMRGVVPEVKAVKEPLVVPAGGDAPKKEAAPSLWDAIPPCREKVHAAA